MAKDMLFLQCLKCGVTYNNYQYQFYDMVELLSVYQVSEHKDICKRCSDNVNKFVNYYGRKKSEDKKKVFQFLASGVLPMRKFNAQMNGGYYG